MMLTLPEVKAKVDQLADSIGASPDVLPTYGIFSRIGCAQIDVDASDYYYLLEEDGETHDSLKTNDIDELLYKVFVNVTFKLSRRYELSQRINNQYSRDVLFQHQLALLGTLSPAWAERVVQQQELLFVQSSDRWSKL
jgi:hypothetical protein